MKIERKLQFTSKANTPRLGGRKASDRVSPSMKPTEIDVRLASQSAYTESKDNDEP
jgi:hypothetical protein